MLIGSRFASDDQTERSAPGCGAGDGVHRGPNVIRDDALSLERGRLVMRFRRSVPVQNSGNKCDISL
ncbi:hypothetical protein SKAU_G00165380 [Synaphobranchus kaupii]|uniref:Uncharacterized protein n=1 Tax=Synaphobranchus kaupii TaxID=118154 RepID=A0A9Q1FJH9_SYNKA|nr:hypothetical protein SKAU_G00165380 [Synaphobranchus kaupii]